MAQASFHLGVVLERRPGVTAWSDEVWEPVAVLPGVPDAPADTLLGPGKTPGSEHIYAGSYLMEWHRTDTPTYRDNLATGDPRIWVVLRPQAEGPPRVFAITADPAEGEMFTEAGNDQVDNVPMPAEIAAALAEFIAEHHVERVFIKRKRRDWASDEPDDMA